MPEVKREVRPVEVNYVCDACGQGMMSRSGEMDPATGDIEHRLEIGGIVEEIYDVNLLPNVIRPMALGFRNDEIRFTIKPEALPEPTGTMN